MMTLDVGFWAGEKLTLIAPKGLSGMSSFCFAKMDEAWASNPFPPLAKGVGGVNPALSASNAACKESARDGVGRRFGN